jgi:MFS family permease
VSGLPYELPTRFWTSTIAGASRDTGWFLPAVTAAFLASFIVSVLIGIPVGHCLDRNGPRSVLAVGSVVAMLAMLAIATTPTLPWFTGAWVLTGVAMSAVFHQRAFAALTHWCQGEARTHASPPLL